jgi:UDP-N-acetylmuramoyl-tripeptide--D-alanyl-D-alanine ligase
MVAILVFAGPFWGALALFAGTLLVDGCLFVLRPVEAQLARKFVTSAEAKLRQFKPTVIAITGSYGKTSTKQYTAHLIANVRTTLATPASFNNLLGLSKTINERLLPGTEVFVAEMGTYGRGEIRALCEHFPPSIAAITTIGEAHLERMRSRTEIAAAKSEILEKASTVVLNIDVPELADLADQIGPGKRVIRCTTRAHADADVRVTRDGDQAVAYLGGEEIARIDLAGTAHETNVAVAIGLAWAAGVPPKQIGIALRSLPDVQHRAVVQKLPSGVTVIDDTYNSNPTGAERAVTAASGLRGDSHLWVVTPGMVELGNLQRQRNEELAQIVVNDPEATLVVVGRTNRSALVDGTRTSGRSPLLFETRAEAAESVLARARPGDVVLFENDLPDHYP